MGGNKKRQFISIPEQKHFRIYCQNIIFIAVPPFTVNDTEPRLLPVRWQVRGEFRLSFILDIREFMRLNVKSTSEPSRFVSAALISTINTRDKWRFQVFCLSVKASESGKKSITEEGGGESCSHPSQTQPPGATWVGGWALHFQISIWLALHAKVFRLIDSLRAGHWHGPPDLRLSATPPPPPLLLLHRGWKWRRVHRQVHNIKCPTVIKSIFSKMTRRYFSLTGLRVLVAAKVFRRGGDVWRWHQRVALVERKRGKVLPETLRRHPPHSPNWMFRRLHAGHGGAAIRKVCAL